MSRHIELEIADLVAGRLPRAREDELRAHLEGCEACAAELAWAERLRDEALRQGLRHLPPMRVVELTEGGEATPAERDHLERCGDCRDELEWSRNAPADDGAGKAAPASFRRWVWLTAAAAVIVLALFWWPRTPQRDWTAIARIEPLPVRITRSAPEGGSFEERRLIALEAYAAGDWSVARERFVSALELSPDDAELLLYLGSAELLDERHEQAASHLRRARDLADGPRLADEARWQLANLALVEGRPADAVPLLRELASAGGHRAAAAKELIEPLD